MDYDIFKRKRLERKQKLIQKRQNTNAPCRLLHLPNLFSTLRSPLSDISNRRSSSQKKAKNKVTDTTSDTQLEKVPSSSGHPLQLQQLSSTLRPPLSDISNNMVQSSSSTITISATPRLGRRSCRKKSKKNVEDTPSDSHLQILLSSSVTYEDMGDPVYTCVSCGALMWYEERSLKSKKPAVPLFSLCCRKGNVELPLMQSPPALLSSLLRNNDSRSKHFCENIRAYNMMFSFTSLGGKIENIYDGRGPPAFRMIGQNYHLIGSLLPPQGAPPKFSQLYIVDTENEGENRAFAYSAKDAHIFKQSIICDLKCMIDEFNPLAKIYRMARQRFLETPTANVKLKLIGNRTRDARRYNIPTTSEVAALIIDDEGGDVSNRDIVLETQSRLLRRINELHPSYLALQYPLLFPYGEDNYTIDIEMSDRGPNQTRKRVKVSIREYFAYRLQERISEGSHIVSTRRLFQHFVVDAYTMIEASRLRYHRVNQKQYRSETFKNLSNAVSDGNTTPSSIGKRVRLPASFTGGARYMIQNYQDAMTICKHFGHPDLFITFTCNSNWPEIIRYVTSRGLTPQDRPDIVCRIFQMKLEAMIHDFLKNKIFGEVKAIIYTIEFQKRGLPHAHIVLFLGSENKLRSTEDIDQLITTEIPDPETDKELHQVVKDCMLHGPCGLFNTSSPCMSSGKCTKQYPKNYTESTHFDPDGFPIYRRRNDGNKVEKNGFEFDNRHVVPYNRYLLLKYRAHINVEACNQSKTIKYLFKYISKGHDRITMQLAMNGEEEVDEIKRYYDCRYVSSCEAAWRIFAFDIHFRRPSVQRLFFHLPGEHSILFEDDEPIDDAVNRVGANASMFLSWMERNKRDADARDLIYSEFPEKYVWNEKEKKWTRRVQPQLTLGRIFHCTPGSGELYYLRLMLNEVKGATSYEDLQTVNGHTYETFKDACYHLGLLDDEKEYIDGIIECSTWGSAHYVRHLFVMLLLSNTLSRPEHVWQETWQFLADDILVRQRRLLQVPDLQLSDKQLKNYALAELELLLGRNGSSLRRYPSMPLPNDILLSEGRNKLIQEELRYDKEELRIEHTRLMSNMTDEQMNVYEKIMIAVNNNTGGVFFLYGHGGTGKTFVWRALSSAIRSKGEIVLTVASSGIASLLIPGGRTAHSRFAIPLDIDEDSTCHIKAGSPLVELLSIAKLIIWDECPMTKRFCFEALDRSLRDVLRFSNPKSMDQPFGGKVVVFGGDFRQILPVVTRGSRPDIVNATINSSYLWQHCEVLKLTKNMRLQQGSSANNSHEIQKFAEWILEVGDGTIGGPNDGEVTIQFPQEVLITDIGNNPIASIVEATYPALFEHLDQPEYFQERAILSPTHDIVDEVNDYLLSLIPGEERVYYSADSICKADGNDAMMYSSDMLHSIKCSGVPNHVLKLKIGVAVMLLRNIDQSNGLCNGTRLMITKLGTRMVEGRIISGRNLGQIVPIPRMLLSPSDSTLPFKFQRRQFPIIVSFAMTINKSQGQSLSQVGLYLPRAVFTHGQLYVGLSRVTSIDGLKVLILDKNGNAISETTNVVYKEVLQNI